MIFSETCDYVNDPSFGSYKDRSYLIGKTFPSGTSDWEILEAARGHELTEQHNDHNMGSENYLTRTLVKVVQIARELPL